MVRRIKRQFNFSKSTALNHYDEDEDEETESMKNRIIVPGGFGEVLIATASCNELQYYIDFRLKEMHVHLHNRHNKNGDFKLNTLLTELQNYYDLIRPKTSKERENHRPAPNQLSQSGKYHRYTFLNNPQKQSTEFISCFCQNHTSKILISSCHEVIDLTPILYGNPVNAAKNLKQIIDLVQWLIDNKPKSEDI